jgi:uncharacterized protein YndB with AHSA1/START domain
MGKSSETDNRILSLERTFNAPLKLVWEAWTQAEHIAQWWGPKGMEIKITEQDFRVGGKWKYTMQMPDGKEFISEGVYLEIVELEKIVTSANFKPMTEGVEIHVLFKENEAKTDFVFSVVHQTEEYCRQQKEMGFYNGWGAAFDRLQAHLQTRIGQKN